MMVHDYHRHERTQHSWLLRLMIIYPTPELQLGLLFWTLLAWCRPPRTALRRWARGPATLGAEAAAEADAFGAPRRGDWGWRRLGMTIGVESSLLQWFPSLVGGALVAPSNMFNQPSWSHGKQPRAKHQQTPPPSCFPWLLFPIFPSSFSWNQLLIILCQDNLTLNPHPVVVMKLLVINYY